MNSLLVYICTSWGGFNTYVLSIGTLVFYFCENQRLKLLKYHTRLVKFVAKARNMETQKNVSLKVIGYDRELRQFKVEFADKEHWVRQTGQELPDYISVELLNPMGSLK